MHFAKYYHSDIKNFIKETLPIGKTSFIYKNKLPNKKYDYIFLPNTLAYTPDVQEFIKKLRKFCHEDTRIVVIYFNFLWKPILDIASYLNFRRHEKIEPNWLGTSDISNLFQLEDYIEIKRGNRFIFPIDLGFVSNFINTYISQLPLINNLSLTTFQIFSLVKSKRNYSTSIIIPARNEEGNMKGVLKKIPKLGIKTEVIFVEGNSKDNTFKTIQNEIRKYKGPIKASLYKQKGKGKADAVRLGFQKARNEILMIMDADLTVPPIDLKRFYNAIAHRKGELINGSRLVYPMEAQAMRALNYLGNKFFSIVFTYLLGQRVKDTLCGTKVLLKRDYLDIQKNKKYFGDFDPFGDFELLFGASKLNLKITEVPVHYKERVYGTTNINRFRHGLILLKMTLFAARKLKFV